MRVKGSDILKFLDYYRILVNNWNFIGSNFIIINKKICLLNNA